MRVVESLARLISVNKSYGEQKVLTNVSLEIHRGDCITLYGYSGSGKSTLLNTLGLVEKVEDGVVEIEGTSVPNVFANNAMLLRRNNIRFMEQSFGLLRGQTIAQNVLVGLAYARLSVRAKRKKVAQAIYRVGLSDMGLHTNINRLSGGQKQRVALARILVKQGDLILMDEPTSALDSENRQMVKNIIQELIGNGNAIIIATHDAFFEEVGNRVINMADLNAARD